jgi:hypothetical protein
MDAFREAVMFIRRVYDLPAEGVELRTPGAMPSALQPA